MKCFVLLLPLLAAGCATGSTAEAPVVHARYSQKGPSNIDMFGPHGVFVSVTNGVVDAETQPPAGDDDLSFWFSCTYDDAGLAVKVAVLDDDARRADTCPSNAVSCAAWDDDAVEIFIDAEFARLPDSRADGGVHLRHGGEFALVANGAANSDYSGYPNTFFRVDRKHLAKKGTANVWWSGCTMPFTVGLPNQAESSKLTLYTFYVPWTAMGRTSRPDRIGFNISVQDDDGGGRRDHALYWVGNPKRPYSDESAFGILVFDP